MKNKFIFSLATIGLAIAAVINFGCSKDSPTNASASSPIVNLAMSFSQTGTNGLQKGYSTLGIDQVRIDSAVVVIDRIKFESHTDSVVTNSIGGNMMMDRDIDISFSGPFVIHVRDTIGINFASTELPAGTYDGVKFKIHSLINGERREDSDMRNHRHFILGDTTIAGSSVMVWGVVTKNGIPTPFQYNFNGEVEFKVSGNFVVPAAGSPVNIALNFNISSFFVDPKTNALLDPTDTSNANRELIRQAIYTAFGKGKCGHDRGDGHPRD